MQADLDPVQRGGGQPRQVTGEGQPVGDQRGGVLGGVVAGDAFQDRAGQRGQQRLAAGEEHPADPGRGQRADRGEVVLGGQRAGPGLAGAVGAGDAGRDLALVVAEPAAELAARGERHAQLPAPAGEVGGAAGQPRRRQIGHRRHQVTSFVRVRAAGYPGVKAIGLRQRVAVSTSAAVCLKVCAGPVVDTARRQSPGSLFATRDVRGPRHAAASTCDQRHITRSHQC